MMKSSWRIPLESVNITLKRGYGAKVSCVMAQSDCAFAQFPEFSRLTG